MPSASAASAAAATPGDWAIHRTPCRQFRKKSLIKVLGYRAVKKVPVLRYDTIMATFGLIEYDQAGPEVRTVYDDIMATRKIDWINNFWKAIAHDPATLKRNWESIKKIKTEVLTGSVTFRVRVDSGRITVEPKQIRPIRWVLDTEWDKEMAQHLFFGTRLGDRVGPVQNDPAMRIPQ
jgi:hypothetical protein